MSRISLPLHNCSGNLRYKYTVCGMSDSPGRVARDRGLVLTTFADDGKWSLVIYPGV